MIHIGTSRRGEICNEFRMFHKNQIPRSVLEEAGASLGMTNPGRSYLMLLASFSCEIVRHAEA